MMFTTLKKKIKEETGNDVASVPVCNQTRRNSLQRSQPHSLVHSEFIDRNLSDNSNGSGESSAYYQNDSISSTSLASNKFTCGSPIEKLNAIIEEKSNAIETLQTQLNDLTKKYDTLLTDYDQMMAEKDRNEKSMKILEEALKVAQIQKEIIYSEQDKIQNFQLEEISKLKNLLHYREQVRIFSKYHSVNEIVINTIPNVFCLVFS